jgi:thiosulfate/3-mercaptopyruvate sulfurtransferase
MRASRRQSLTIAGTLAGLVACAMMHGAAGAADLEYLRDPAGAIQAGQTIVDARPPEECEARSLAGARCLAAVDFLGPHHRLAAFADIAWLLGTAGLSGSETLLVIGDDATERDFVAGLLHAMGQKQVRVLTEPATRLVSAGTLATAPGTARGTTRKTIYVAPARDAAIAYADGIGARIVLDGRSEDEYWGLRVRGQRGGHLPGADHLPAPALRAALARGERPGPGPEKGAVVVYGHDAYEGFAYLTLVRAGLGLDAAVYPGGWTDWAATARPANALTYPDHAPVETTGPAIASGEWSMPGIAASIFVAGIILGIGFFIGRGRAA